MRLVLRKERNAGEYTNNILIATFILFYIKIINAFIMSEIYYKKSIILAIGTNRFLKNNLN